MPRLTQAGVAAALRELAGRDADIARAMAVSAKIPRMRRTPPGFPGLMDIIVDQQVSKASGAAIRGRLHAAVEPLTAEAFLRLGDDDLRAIGFSRQKMRYGRALADAVISGRLNVRAIARMPEEEAIAALTEIPGIGRWTAEIYLMFALGRPDVWPADDLAIVVAVQRLFGLPDRPKRPEMLARAEPWRPARTSAAVLLWRYYKITGRSGMT